MNFESSQNNVPLKILIVDDEADICYLLSAMLRKKNIETSSANSLSEASVALEAFSPQIVILDNQLPDGLGMNFISHIKSKLPGCKVVMITAHDTAPNRERAINEGVDSFIGKPFTRDIIYQTVEHLLN